MDLRNFFRKFVFSVYILKNYHPFNELKQLCQQSGILKSLPIAE